MYVSGQVAINHDLQPVFDADLERGEAIAIPIAILVLLVVFGTLTATLVPLLMAAGTVPVTLGLLWLLAHELNMAIYVTNLVTLIGIAIAIDYSLLVVYRFREELLGGSMQTQALRTTMRTAGHAVLFSGRDRRDRPDLPRADPAAVHPLHGGGRAAHPARLDRRGDDAAPGPARDLRLEPAAHARAA